MFWWGFLLCFARLGFLFCCLSRAVESVVRCLGGISAEVDVNFFLILYFLSRTSGRAGRRQRALQGRAEALGQPLLTWAVAPASLALLRHFLPWNTVSDTLEERGKVILFPVTV